ncbi:MAG: PAS domain-containing sensor histidine kinase [Acidobacteriota bacterium]|nr:PAS domain-containing sensor histidine kinase [Acidobacteriota bacterium]
MSNKPFDLHDAERAAYTLAAIIDSSDDAIVSKDLNSIVRSWNKAAEAMFQFTAEEMIGKSILTIIPVERRGEEEEVLAKVRAGVPVSHFETVRQRKDGSLVEISLTVSPVKDANGTIIGASKIARDISRQNALVRELAEASRIKDEFLATLSHELRTPLNAVIGYTQMLRSGHIAEARRQQVVEIVERNAQLLSQLVSDVLDVSSVVTGKLRVRLAIVDLCEIATSSIEIVQPSADAKGVIIESPHSAKPCLVRGDADRLHQAIWNLLTNAVKFTPSGGRVTVSVAPKEDQIELAVADTGIGIPAAFVSRVFERFTQAEGGSRREFAGLGLGLSLVHYFIEAHGGTVTAESDGEGKGATFRILLPAANLA